MAAERVRERVVTQLRALPWGSVIDWGDDASGHQELLDDDLLIWAPRIARPLGLPWLWSVTAAEPDAGMHAMSIVIHPDPPGGWAPATVSGVLQDWAAVHAGRPDLTFRYQPAFVSDLARRLAEQTISEQ